MAVADVRGRQEEAGARTETLERAAAANDEGARRTQGAVDALLRGNIPALERALGELRVRQEHVESTVGSACQILPATSFDAFQTLVHTFT